MTRRKILTGLIILFLFLVLPITLFLVKQQTNNRSNAAAPDQLEAEGGVLGGNAKIQTDSNASGGQYILFSNQTTGIYGPGVNIDSKNNYQIGWINNQKVAHKFRASTTSNLKEVLTTFRMGPIYSGGTGGKVKISVQTEDGTSNHFPSGNVLTSVDYIPGNAEGGATTRLTFPTPASLTKGNLYYIVYENIDPSPATNYVSVNHIYTFEKMTPRQPILSDNDYGVFTKSTSGWTLKPNDTPSLDLVYADGTHDGIAYLQAFYDSEGTSAQEIISRISGAQMTRELFTVSGGNKTITQTHVRVGREFGNSPLTVSLKTGAGTLIESKTIPASSVAQWAEYIPSQIYGATNPTWVSVTFSNPQTLTNGQTYQLVLSTPSDTKYSMLPIRYVDFTPGFDTASTAMQSYAFRDGRAQDTQNAGQTWENVYSFQSESNMQFYFSTTDNQSTQTPTPTPIQKSDSIYGSGVAGDALNNTRIGADYNYKDDIRFRAAYSGSFTSFRPYIIYSTTKPGYSGGIGGTLKFELRTDDGTTNHGPSNNVLATVIHSSPMSKGNFPLISFPTPVNLTAGQLYHLTVTNTDPDPATNYVSMDHTFVSSPTSPMQPKYNDLDWAELISHSNGPYELRTENTPILAIYYADGSTQGYGYMEVWVGAPMQISGVKSVREKITVTGGNKNISELNIRLKRVSGVDPLTFKIIKNDGSILEQGNIPSSSISTTSHNWVRYVFPSQKQLINSQTYFLTFTAPSSSVYEAFPIRQGVGYNFPATTYFSDGIAEYTTDGTNWKGWKQWGVDNRREQNLQFYFK